MAIILVCPKIYRDIITTPCIRCIVIDPDEVTLHDTSRFFTRRIRGIIGLVDISAKDSLDKFIQILGISDRIIHGSRQTVILGDVSALSKLEFGLGFGKEVLEQIKGLGIEFRAFTRATLVEKLMSVLTDLRLLP